MTAPEEFCYLSPLGPLNIRITPKGVAEVSYSQDPNPRRSLLASSNRIALKLSHELDEYFAGRSGSFAVPLDLGQGTGFQRKVWQAMLTIPKGQVRTYKQIAEQIGKPKASRAVGQAAASNPICIVVPCHRVVASNGLGGYGRRVDLKLRLLQLEGALTVDMDRLSRGRYSTTLNTAIR